MCKRIVLAAAAAAASHAASFSPSLPRTQPTPLIKSEQQQQQSPVEQNNPAYAAQMAMQGVVNPVAPQGPQPWDSSKRKRRGGDTTEMWQ